MYVGVIEILLYPSSYVNFSFAYYVWCRLYNRPRNLEWNPSTKTHKYLVASRLCMQFSRRSHIKTQQTDVRMCICFNKASRTRGGMWSIFFFYVFPFLARPDSISSVTSVKSNRPWKHNASTEGKCLVCHARMWLVGYS